MNTPNEHIEAGFEPPGSDKPIATATPRTDSECDDYAGPLCWIDGTQFIPADFARTLERELSSAQAALAEVADIQQSCSNWECACKANDNVVAGLKTRVAELEQDKARLDWLDKNGREHGYGPQWRIAWEFGQADNIRAAIDAARKGQP